MLQLVLAGEGDHRDRSVGALVSDALSCRANLTGARRSQPGRRSGPVAERVADTLAYDAALVRLCNRLELQHDLTGDGDARTARVRAETRLAERLPSLASALESREGGGR
jgi:hypothetical protein